MPIDTRGRDLYEVGIISNPAKTLNQPVEVIETYVDKNDGKIVYSRGGPPKKKSVSNEPPSNKPLIPKTASNKPPKSEIPVINNPPKPVINNPPKSESPNPPETVINKPESPVINKPIINKPESTETVTPKKNEEELPADDKVINFYWVRHAESASNLYNNKPTDNYPKESNNPLNLKIEVQRFLNNDYNNVQKMKKKVVSSSTLIGGGEIVEGDYPLVDEVYKYIADFANQENEKITDYKTLANDCKSNRTDTTFESSDQDQLNKIYDFKGSDPNNGTCIKTVQSLVKENYVPKENEKPVSSGSIPGYDTLTLDQKNEIAQLYARWLQNFIPTNFLFQPTLTHMGITQASILGEQFANNDNLKKIKPNIIICSAMVRTMMTAYLTVLFANATRGEENKLPTTIYIVPYINEKQHDAKFVFPPNEQNNNFYDFADVAIHPDKIQEVAKVIETWFKNNYKPLFADIYEKNKENGYNPTIPDAIPDDITFDTNMYITEGEVNDKELVRQVDIKKFKTFFKDKNIKEDSPFNKIKNILVICHGFVIDEIHTETGINLIKSIIKEVDSQEVFNTWGCNTSVFYHPYFINEKHDPFENACLVKSVDEFNTFNGALASTDNKDKDKSKYTQLIKNLGLDEKLLEQIDALKESIVKKTTQKADLEKIKPIIDKLKEKYLLYYLQGDKLVRNKATTNLRAEDITKYGDGDDGEAKETLISLRPGSLRGDIALITHGAKEKAVEEVVAEDNTSENVNEVVSSENADNEAVSSEIVNQAAANTNQAKTVVTPDTNDKPLVLNITKNEFKQFLLNLRRNYNTIIIDPNFLKNKYFNGNTDVEKIIKKRNFLDLIKQIIEKIDNKIKSQGKKPININTFNEIFSNTENKETSNSINELKIVFNAHISNLNSYLNSNEIILVKELEDYLNSFIKKEENKIKQNVVNAFIRKKGGKFTKSNKIKKNNNKKKTKGGKNKKSNNRKTRKYKNTRIRKYTRRHF